MEQRNWINVEMGFEELSNTYLVILQQKLLDYLINAASTTWISWFFVQKCSLVVCLLRVNPKRKHQEY